MAAVVDNQLPPDIARSRQELERVLRELKAASEDATRQEELLRKYAYWNFMMQWKEAEQCGGQAAYDFKRKAVGTSFFGHRLCDLKRMPQDDNRRKAIIFDVVLRGVQDETGNSITSYSHRLLMMDGVHMQRESILALMNGSRHDAKSFPVEFVKAEFEKIVEQLWSIER